MLYQVSTKSKYNLVIWQYTITKVFVNIGYDVYGANVNNLNGMKVYLQIRKVYYMYDNTETYIDRYTYNYTRTYIHVCTHNYYCIHSYCVVVNNFFSPHAVS